MLVVVVQSARQPVVLVTAPLLQGLTRPSLTCVTAITAAVVADRGLSQAYGLAVDARGGFSGGTIASGFNQAESESSADVAALMADKYFLLPQEAK